MEPKQNPPVSLPPNSFFLGLHTSLSISHCVMVTPHALCKPHHPILWPEPPAPLTSSTSWHIFQSTALSPSVLTSEFHILAWPRACPLRNMPHLPPAQGDRPHCSSGLKVVPRAIPRCLALIYLQASAHLPSSHDHFPHHPLQNTGGHPRLSSHKACYTGQLPLCLPKPPGSFLTALSAFCSKSTCCYIRISSCILHSTF